MIAPKVAKISKSKHPVVERDPNPFMRVSGPFKDDALQGREKRFLDLADIALGTKQPERRKRHNPL